MNKSLQFTAMVQVVDTQVYACMYVCYLKQGACTHFVICDFSANHMKDKRLNSYAQRTRAVWSCE